jgi:hypothetical protein
MTLCIYSLNHNFKPILFYKKNILPLTKYYLERKINNIYWIKIDLNCLIDVELLIKFSYDIQ